VALVNALPKPLTLPCYLEALALPLRLHASLSVFSAQPAGGPGSPRIFIYFEPLLMTVEPTGIGAHLLEFREQRDEHRSLKGELAFPLHEPVAPGEVYEHTLFSEEVSALFGWGEVVDWEFPSEMATLD
jgi:hypothetical protein